jgi:glycosyltransferase involved in cell wall biosynthesis
MTRLIIHAPNVHQGGGAILLEELLSSISSDIQTLAILDVRFKVPIGLHSNLQIRFIKPTILKRLKAEVLLFKLVCKTDRVLCFGNLPPLFKLKSDPSVFLQNRYLVDRSSPIFRLPIRTKIRIYIEIFWLWNFKKNARHFIVQTRSMQTLAESFLGTLPLCSPFVPEVVKSLRERKFKNMKYKYDFVYVASGEAHKNHFVLIEAWRILAAEGLYPSLAFTFSSESAPKLYNLVENEIALNNLRIKNLGLLPYENLLVVYRESGALIYPSEFESFGLPLIEAKQIGMPILAPELDYVRDVLDPNETFDPRSPISIARAVKRYLGGGSTTIQFRSAREWMDQFVYDKFK